MPIIGHRGFRGKYPENTLFGFQKLIETGCKHVEFDININSSLELYVTHDPWLEISNDTISLFEKSLAEILTFTAKSQFSNSSAKIPSLDDVFHFFSKTDLFLFIEIKSESDWIGKYQVERSQYARVFLEKLASYSFKGGFMVQSFDPLLLNELYKLNQTISYGLLVEEAEMLQNGLKILDFRPDYLNPHFSFISKPLIDTLKKQKIKTATWTVNDKNEYKRLKEFNLDGIITDFPDDFMVLEE